MISITCVCVCVCNEYSNGIILVNFNFRWVLLLFGVEWKVVLLRSLEAGLKAFHSLNIYLMANNSLVAEGSVVPSSYRVALCSVANTLSFCRSIFFSVKWGQHHCRSLQAAAMMHIKSLIQFLHKEITYKIIVGIILNIHLQEKWIGLIPCSQTP